MGDLLIIVTLPLMLPGLFGAFILCLALFGGLLAIVGRASVGLRLAREKGGKNHA
jgi:hypothetical protein